AVPGSLPLPTGTAVIIRSGHSCLAVQSSYPTVPVVGETGARPTRTGSERPLVTGSRAAFLDPALKGTLGGHASDLAGLLFRFLDAARPWTLPMPLADHFAQVGALRWRKYCCHPWLLLSGSNTERFSGARGVIPSIYLQISNAPPAGSGIELITGRF